MDHVVQRADAIRRREGGPAREHAIGDDPQSEHIRTVVDLFPARLLRRHVTGRADRAHRQVAGVSIILEPPKSSTLGSLPDQEQVLGLQVPVHDIRLVGSCQRLRNLVKSGFSAYAAGLECQNHMLALAEAFVERWVLEALDEKISSAQDAALTDLLDPVRSLYALHTIEGHKGWYLEQEYIQPVKSKAIRKTVDELCLELRQKAVVLTDAFGIPDHLIAAPIAV